MSVDGKAKDSYLRIKMEKSHKNPLLQAKELLAEAQKSHKAVICYYSGGKDSLVVLDMCSKMGFEKIVCVHKYFIPDLEVVEKQIRYAKSRWGVDVIQYPSNSAIKSLKAGEFNDPSPDINDLPNIDASEIERIAREETGISLICTGHKRTDAFGQGLSNAEWANRKRNIVQPIIFWNKFHVLAYLKSNDIPLPESDGRNSSSMDLHPKNIIWLYKNHINDFRKIEKVFPYIEAIVWRNKFYEKD